jgi:hypothetical protein
MVMIKKPRFFCNASGAKSKIEKWRKSAKKFFHFCKKMCCKKTLVFLQRVKSDSNAVCARLCNFYTNRFSAILTLPTTPWSPPPIITHKTHPRFAGPDGGEYSGVKKMPGWAFFYFDFLFFYFSLDVMSESSFS